MEQFSFLIKSQQTITHAIPTILPVHFFKLHFFIAKFIHCQCTVYISIYFQVTDLHKPNETLKKLKKMHRTPCAKLTVFSKNEHCEYGHWPGWSSVQFSDKIEDFPTDWAGRPQSV